MNQCNFTGIVFKPPRMVVHGKKEGKEKLMTYFTLQVKRDFVLKGIGHDYIPCISSGRVAELVKKSVRQGTPLFVQGRWQNNNLSNTGQELVIKKLEFLTTVEEKDESGIIIEKASTYECYESAGGAEPPFEDR